MEITVKAFVRRLEEEDILNNNEELGIAPKIEFVWNQMGIPVDQVYLYWGQSKNRCVIELKSGRLILVASTFDDLKTHIKEIREEQLAQAVAYMEEGSEEEDLILGGDNEDPTEE